MDGDEVSESDKWNSRLIQWNIFGFNSFKLWSWGCVTKDK